MNPIMGRMMLSICFILLVMCIIALLGVKPNEVEFYVTLISLIIVITALTLTIWDIRRQVKKLKTNTTIPESRS